MLSVARLRVLVEVARQGSFSGAADALSYTQSAVSQQIANLEAEVGMTLLERGSRGVRTTVAGQALVEHAEGIMASLETAELELRAIAGLRGGRLRMASFPTAGSTLMPPAIAAFREAHPDVELTLAEGEPEQILPRLAAGELDLALAFEFASDGAGPDEESREKRLHHTGLLEDRMYLALPSGAPLAGREDLTLADLRDESWVQPSSASACARHVVRWCHAAGFEPRVAFESDDYQTVQGLVAAGVGVALIPELALSAVREGVSIRDLRPRTPRRLVTAVTPATARASPAAAAMLQILQGVAASRRAAS